MQPKIGNLAKAALAFVAGIGGELLKFLASLAVAGIMMAYGEGGARAIRSIFERVAGDRGGEFVDLSTATIRAVAKGVLGVAFLQAIIVGICLLIAGIPWAGVLAAIVLVLGIAQVPAVIVTLPAIGYLWSSGNYGTGAAVLYTVLLLVAGMADNVLKPLMLGRGVDAPMPVILLGASAAWPRQASSGCSSARRFSRSATRFSWMGRDESRRAAHTSGRRSVPGRLNPGRVADSAADGADVGGPPPLR
jgi:predicted PurR-regulated permease PerM